MTTLTLTKNVRRKDGSKSTITVEADDAGCTVKWLSNSEKLEWHVCLDVAQLAEVFEGYPVYIFAGIVTLLGQVWTAMEAIKT